MSPKNFHMRRSCRISALLALSCLAVPALAAPAADVPAKHWASKSVQSVTSKKLMDSPNGKFNGDKVVTRYELAVVLDRLVTYIEAGKKPLNPGPRPKPVKIPTHADAAVRGALQRLTSENFLSPDSLLLKGTGSEPVTAKQLSDLLAAFTIRISDRSLPLQED